MKWLGTEIQGAGQQATGETTNATIKGLQGIVLQSLFNGMKNTQRNQERFMRGIEATAAKHMGIKVDDLARSPGKGDDEMRVDSDDFRVIYQEGPKNGLLPLAVMAASIAIPGLAAVWKAPDIIRAIWPETTVTQPAETPPAQPTDTGATKPFQDSWMTYDITTG